MMCPRCGLRFAVPAGTDEDAAAAVAYTGATAQDRGIATGPLASEDAGAHDTGELADVDETPGTDEGYPYGETGEPADAAADDEGGAAFITGESVSLSTGDTDTGALAGRSTRAGDDPIFASLPDVADDVPSDAAGPPVPYVPYEAPYTPDDLDAGEVDEVDEVGAEGVDDGSQPYDVAAYDVVADDTPGADEAPPAYDGADYDPGTYDPAAYGGAAYVTGTLGGQDVPYEATPEPAPEPAPEAVQDLASDIARDAESTPEIVGAPVAMSIPTTSVVTVTVEDEQKSRNQLLAAGVAALAVLVLCVAVILAAGNAGRGDVTPTVEALASPTGQVVAIATVVTETPDTTSPNPTTDAIPVPTGTATTGPVIVPTDTVLTLPTEVVLPTDTSLPVPTDTLPTETVAPVPTDTAPPAPTDTLAPLPTDTRAPVPTGTTAPASTNTQVTRPTNTTPPLPPTRTAVPPRPTATQPAIASTHDIDDIVTGFNGWTVQPRWAVTRSQLPSPDPQVFYRPSGVYWLVRVDVRNTLSQSRSFGGTMDFVMRDTNGNLYAELSNHGRAPGVREIARIQGFSYLDAVLDQGEEAATLLIYDIPSGAQPAQVVGRIRQGNGVQREGQVVWNLNP